MAQVNNDAEIWPDGYLWEESKFNGFVNSMIDLRNFYHYMAT